MELFMFTWKMSIRREMLSTSLKDSCAPCTVECQNKKHLWSIQFHTITYCQPDAEELIPGQISELTFGLLPTSVLVRKGHRIRIAIAGHDAGTFTRIPAEGQPDITVAHNEAYASSINLPISRMTGDKAG
jgi:hypothetical protein